MRASYHLVSGSGSRLVRGAPKVLVASPRVQESIFKAPNYQGHFDALPPQRRPAETIER
jgi:hypothetical protein